MTTFLLFFAKNWRVILASAILGYCLWLFNALQRERDDAVHNLAEYKRLQTELSAKQAQEFEVKLIRAESLINIEKIKAQQQLDQLGIERVKISTELKRLYDNKIITLRRELAGHNSVLPPSSGAEPANQTASDTGQPASGESIGDAAAYRTLEQACQITTIDYNQLRGWADTVCEMAECADR
ncbi:MAG: hypothetical protein WBP13_00735 [Methylophilaceae bacterium]